MALSVSYTIANSFLYGWHIHEHNMMSAKQIQLWKNKICGFKDVHERSSTKKIRFIGCKAANAVTQHCSGTQRNSIYKSKQIMPKKTGLS